MVSLERQSLVTVFWNKYFPVCKKTDHSALSCICLDETLLYKSKNYRIWYIIWYTAIHSVPWRLMKHQASHLAQWPTPCSFSSTHLMSLIDNIVLPPDVITFLATCHKATVVLMPLFQKLWSGGPPPELWDTLRFTPAWQRTKYHLKDFLAYLVEYQLLRFSI